ncbi:MAG: [FeFe] hydrogenase, group A [Deltaproteobacteria bacterium]|jgi:ferredoxin hydrogenase large subunit|nr:[FeFe] hydrogenase, group A [Deltaproteobacteria bacterium]
MSERVVMEGIYYENSWPAPGTDPDDLYFVEIDEEKCIGCDTCQTYCPTGAIWGDTGDAHKIAFREICVNCGQCLTHCPENAIYETQSWVGEVNRMLAAKSKKVIAMPAPAVRYALGDCFGLSVGTVSTDKMFSALKKLGFDHCWDNEFGADVTIWEEGDEFVKRLTGKISAPLPQFTSCCPGWHKYVESLYPELLTNLSTAKSPIGMLGALSKTYGPDTRKYRREDVYTVSIMPCTAKKYEGLRPELRSSGYPDIDATIDTRELAYMLKQAGIDLKAMPDGERDPLMGESTGGATLFGVTGGVMEAALRFAYQAVTGREPSSWDFAAVRGLKGVKEAEVVMGDAKIKVAVVHGAKRFKDICEAVKKGEAPWQFIEFMACPGGCVCGGGQPVMPGVMELAGHATKRFMASCRKRLKMMSESRA